MPPASDAIAVRLTCTLDLPDVSAVLLAAAELRSAADRRRKVAERASGELMREKRTGETSDIRTGAVHVVKTLGEADDLVALAEVLEAAATAPPAPQNTSLPIDLGRLDPANRVEPGPGDASLVDDDAGDDADMIEAARLALGVGPRGSTFDGDEDDPHTPEEE